jgi:hypothetical protein
MSHAHRRTIRRMLADSKKPHLIRRRRFREFVRLAPIEQPEYDVQVLPLKSSTG